MKVGAWTVLCPYYFSTENVIEMEEINIIRRIQSMPPSEMELNGLSISAIKTIYAFCFQNPYFSSCQMDYDHSVFVNTSLAWSIRESIYKQYENFSGSVLKQKFMRGVFNIMQGLVRENVFYKYDNSAQMLDEYYQR